MNPPATSKRDQGYIKVMSTNLGALAAANGGSRYPVLSNART
jgi:hypothetical protein